MNEKIYEGKKPGWCPGCGDYAVLNALKKVFAKNKIPPSKIVIVSGIGCSGKLGDYVATNSIHTLHGRVLPVATAVKLSNPELIVIGASGDGDTYAIGLSHFIHSCRRNPEIIHIVMNNQVYGLTKGQFSPTSLKGFVSTSTPYGVFEEPVDGVLLALESGATFVARGFSGDVDGLVKIFERALNHKGFSFIDVLSPCVTFNRLNTYEWFKERIIKMEEPFGIRYLPRAIRFAREAWEEGRFLTGIIYEVKKPTLSDLILKDKVPLVKKSLEINKQEVLEMFSIFK
jgi:2-oxoglutarate ferredoxin oxidoreductase subunit beta